MEALALVVVFAVSALIFIITWFGVQGEAGRNPQAERAKLEAYRVTLREKNLRAQHDRWDETMKERLAEELNDVEERLARIPVSS